MTDGRAGPTLLAMVAKPTSTECEERMSPAHVRRAFGAEDDDQHVWRPSEGAPAGVRPMRYIGLALLAFCVVASALGDPHAGLRGDELLVTLGVAGFAAGLVLGATPGRFTRPRIPALLLVAASADLLIIVQDGKNAAIGGLYAATIFAALRLPRRAAVATAVVVVASGVAAYALGDVSNAGGAIASILTGIPPWFIVIRVLRELRLRNLAAEELVDELRDSRAAQAEAAAVAERGRVARDMHDVLAHSLSALSLQLEGARLLARDRGTDRDVVDAIERAHHLAASGLQEARRAIGALRGEELPGPEGLPALIDAFCSHSSAPCTLTTEGEARPLESEARLAIYRTAQEALTNIRKHAAADRVDVVLSYDVDAVRLRVQDHGPGAPVTVGGTGGYGLTGMRERAELLGGRLDAGPTTDGFRVELWLPA